jgi:hypothetical protein
MNLPNIFVASSSEGLDLVESVRESMQAELHGIADVKPWPGQFQLTLTTIESLERLVEAADFAVLVLTPDDHTTSREIERLTPRDNVVFELGFFFGRLGRERCFFIQARDQDLKLPSDVLGVEPATYLASPGQDPRPGLQSASARIAKTIRQRLAELPSRPRLTADDRSAQAAIRRFGDRIRGSWWERIRFKGKPNALSFFTLEFDDRHNSVRLDGTAYNLEGSPVANWKSAAARLEGNKLLYVRECQHLDDSRSTAWLPGLGEAEFERSEGVIERGRGKFWESDESRLETTVVKLGEYRRSFNPEDERVMLKGTELERAARVDEMLRTW